MSRLAAPGLRATQEMLWDLIRAPEGVAKGLAERAGARGGREEDLGRVLRGDARLGPVERLDIYANMYFFRLRDCLRQDYPKTSAVLGGAAFHDLITDFVLAHPSRHWSLSHVGAPLPRFLRQHPATGEHPFLPGLAELEWARVEVFDAAAALPLTRTDLGAGAGEGAAPLKPIPALRVLDLEWDAAAVWRELEAKSAAEEPAPAHSAAIGEESCTVDAPAAIASPRRQRTRMRVFRQDGAVYHRVIAEDEARCLDEIVAAGSLTLTRLGEILIADLERHEAKPAGDPVASATRRLAEILSDWLDDEVLTT